MVTAYIKGYRTYRADIGMLTLVTVRIFWVQRTGSGTVHTELIPAC